MSLIEAVKILKYFNKWRRGDEDIAQPNPTTIGIAIDTVIEFCENRGCNG